MNIIQRDIARDRLTCYINAVLIIKLFIFQSKYKRTIKYDGYYIHTIDIIHIYILQQSIQKHILRTHNKYL